MATGARDGICFESRRHGAALARPFAQALALAGAGVVLVVHGWPVSPAGALALALGALVGVRAAWRWERTRIVITRDRLLLLEGTVRRRVSAVRLSRVSSVEIEQSVPGRLLGYGTLVAGELAIPFVARPHELARVLD